MKRKMQCTIICVGIAILVVPLAIRLLNKARYIDIRLPEIATSSGWSPIEYVCLKYSDHLLDHAWIVRKRTAIRSESSQQAWDTAFPQIDVTMRANGWQLWQDAARTTPYFPQSEFLSYGPGGYVKYHKQARHNESRDLPSVAYVGVWSTADKIWEISVVAARPSFMARAWNKF
jgi:hypothetical protein